MRRALEGVGLGPADTRADLERLGFFVCERDLEDELIRALGAARVEALVEAQGDLGSFRTLQKQAAWRGRPVEEQLRRFFGSGGRRKIRYAPLLVEALDLARVPRALDGVLSSRLRSASTGALASLARSLRLRVDLGGEEQRQGAEPEPGQHDDHRGERPPRLAGGAEEREVDREAA